VHGVSAASNGDISVSVNLGVELGATLHVGETVTGLIGAAQTASEMIGARVRKTLFGDPHATDGSPI
jgi:hypothetical protein